MWNRVVLLISGMAFGWSLVNYWTVAQRHVDTQRTRMALSLGAGVIMAALLAKESFAAAGMALIVFAFSALVAYAGNAKQINKVEEPLPPKMPERPSPDGVVGVFLVARGEPRRYEGPAQWAIRFRDLAARGEAVPHWFVRPLTYGRIRKAYGAMGGESPLHNSLETLARDLGEQLGTGYMVQLVYTDSDPLLLRALTMAPERGVRQLAILPLDLEKDAESRLRREVARSRIREVGMELRYASPLDPPLLPQDTYDTRACALMQGQPVCPPELDERAVSDLLTREF